MNDLPVSDIDADMTFMPNGQPGDFRDRINGTFFFSVDVHGICANIRHAVCAIFNLSCFHVEPAIALDKTNAVHSTTTNPVLFNEVSIAADLVGILLCFCPVQAPRQNLSVGSPNVAPSSGVSILCPFHEIEIVLGVWIDISCRRNIHRSDCTHHFREVFC